jgi:hypothetical protein
MIYKVIYVLWQSLTNGQKRPFSCNGYVTAKANGFILVSEVLLLLGAGTGTVLYSIILSQDLYGTSASPKV